VNRSAFAIETRVFAERPGRAPPRGRARRGISLVEVMMSIGVITVGLLGVVLLLPFALHQTQQGILADRSSDAGRRAMREFEIRGFNDRSRWIAIDPDPNNSYATSVYAPEEGDPFCIDPLGLAAFTLPPQNSPNPALNAPASFPTGGGSSAPMRRITVSAAPGGAAMSPPLARATFTMQDDLEFELPGDRTLPPVQKKLHGRRMATGKLSWFATVTPQWGTVNSIYSLSIVVVNERLVHRVNNESIPGKAQEQVAKVEFLGGGWGGGEVRLTGSKIQIRPGNWFLAAKHVNDKQDGADGEPTLPLRRYYQWYRVVATETLDEVDSLRATVVGADWNGNDSSGADTWLEGTVADAILVEGVVAVYQKTVKITSGGSLE
jgi:hypothetical protein